MTQQGDRQASVRAITGTALTYEGDFMAMFDGAGIAAGDFDGRLLAWINKTLATSYTEINGAMQAYADAFGAFNWSSLGTLDPYPGAVAAFDFKGPVVSTRPFYKLNGVVYATPATVPGWSSSRASIATGPTSATDPTILTYGIGVARVIPGLGFLYEGARTNIIFPSTPATLPGGANAWNPDWNGHASTIAANDRVAPTGAVVASKITTTFATEGLYYRSTSVPSANAVWAFSLWVYSLTPVTVTTIIGESGGNAWVGGPFVTGTTNVPANTWTRCSMTATALATVTATTVSYAATVPLSGATFWVWNGQAEAGECATSDIVTTSGTVTRAADAAAVTGVTLPNSGATWTLYGQAYLPNYNVLTYQGVCGVDDVLATNQVTIFASAGGRAREQLSSGGVSTYDSSNGLSLIPTTIPLKLSATYSGGKITAEAMGVALASVTATAPVNTTRLLLGLLNGSAQPTNGYIQAVALYPTAISGLTA